MQRKCQGAASNFQLPCIFMPKFSLILEEVAVVNFKVFSWLVREQNKKNISRHNWSLDRDVNPEFPEYEARALPIILAFQYC
jgi:hypothetical protein